MSIKGNLDDVVGKETLVAGRTMDNYCTDSDSGTKMDDVDKPCTDSNKVCANDLSSVTIGDIAADVIGQKIQETSAVTIPTVAQTTAKKIAQCKTDLIKETATAEMDTRELMDKETGCGNHAELTDVCNNTDVIKNEWNKVTLQEPLSVDVDTETKEKSNTQINAESDEIETSVVSIQTVAQTTAKKIAQCRTDLIKETATAEMDTRELMDKETGCGNHAEPTDICNNTDVVKNEWNTVTLQELLAMGVDTETKENSPTQIDAETDEIGEIATSTDKASTHPEIDLTKEGAMEIADVENSSTPKNALITDGGKAVKLAPANKELMSVMAATLDMSRSCAKESDDKAVHSVFEKLLSAVTDRVDNNNMKMMKTSENVVKKKDDEIGIFLDQQKSVPSTPTSDALSKTSSSKFTCIGPAQLVARKVVSHAKSGPSRAPLSSESKRTTKHTEKFLVKNVSKVSKMYKVSNLSYKIKPVRKDLGSSPTYPVIYVGEPAFMDDFLETGHNVVAPPTEVKEDDLYDISKLQNAFTSTENVSELNRTPSIGKPYPYSDILHPSLNSRPSFLPPSPALNQLFIPPSTYSYPGIPNFKAGGVIRIVARTVPSATIASHTTTTTSGSKMFSLSTHNRTYQAIKSVPLTAVGGPARPVILQTRAPPASVARQHTGPAPVTILSPQIKVLQNTSAVKRGVMTVNFLPGKNTAITKTEAAKPKIRQPVKFLPSSAQPIFSNSLTVMAGKYKTPASLVIIPSKKDAKVRPAVQSLTTNMCSVVDKITVPMPEPVAKIAGNLTADCGPNACKQLSIVNSPITTSSKSLRQGVEVMFEDGVRHFITSLNQMTHEDDEPIKSWTDLKKGAEVVAKWVDGQLYDATVVACYFSVEKKLQPVVKIEKLTEKSLKIPPKVQKRKENDSSIRCTVCRSVFDSLGLFRKHLKMKCKSPGIIFPKSAMVVSDVTVEAVGKGGISASMKKIKSPSSETKKGNKQYSRKRVMKEAEIGEKSPLKKRKITPVEKPVVLNKADDDAIFKIGTKFLHRWQLDDGTSKWYHGEVIRTVSKDKAFLDRVFEVSYKGESENYFLKLYEDYPADIRIMGKT